MRRSLLIIITLSVFATYSKGQGNTFASAGQPAICLNDARSNTSPASESLAADDQDETPVITFYPNPVRENLNIRFRERGNYVIRVYNVVGAKIKEKRVEDDNILKLDVSDLPKGMYFLSFEPGNGKVITKTFTKED